MENNKAQITTEQKKGTVGKGSAKTGYNAPEMVDIGKLGQLIREHGSGVEDGEGTEEDGVVG